MLVFEMKKNNNDISRMTIIFSTTTTGIECMQSDFSLDVTTVLGDSIVNQSYLKNNQRQNIRYNNHMFIQFFPSGIKSCLMEILKIHLDFGSHRSSPSVSTFFPIAEFSYFIIRFFK